MIEAVVEVCWTEPETACVLHGEHCWHVQIATGLGAAHIVGGARCCCWCGLRQTAHQEQDLDRDHGLLGPAPLSLLDVAMRSGRG
jgi:hypothetical protein